MFKVQGVEAYENAIKRVIKILYIVQTTSIIQSI